MLNAEDPHNAAFKETGANQPWIEVFHSRPSWKATQISYKKESDAWIPFGSFQLIDASHIQPGFRVFRIKAIRLEFRFANGKTSSIDSNYGRNYIVHSPGRFVVEPGSGCRRVSNAMIADCLRPLRPKDSYVELWFETERSWRNCYVTYITEGDTESKWYKLGMTRSYELGRWFLSIKTKLGIRCAFTDGGNRWDSNRGENYHIALPGRYVLGSNSITYEGISRLDMHFWKHN